MMEKKDNQGEERGECPKDCGFSCKLTLSDATLMVESNKRRKKNVSFHPNLSSMVSIANVDNYTTEERANSWYTIENISLFRREAEEKSGLVARYYRHLVEDMDDSMAVADEIAELLDENELENIMEQDGFSLGVSFFFTRKTKSTFCCLSLF